MDGQPPIIEIHRVGRTDRRAPVVLVLAALALALAVLKPWDSTSERPSTADIGPSGAATPRAVVVPTVGGASAAGPGAASPRPEPSLTAQQAAALEALDRRQCQSNLGWRVVTVEESGKRHTRTLLVVDPVALRSDASDPRIPAVVLYAERLLAIGYCVPSADGAAPDRPNPDVAIWRVPAAGAPVRIEDVTPLDRGLMAAGEYYYGPPAPRAHEPWAAGRYVFQILPDGVSRRAPASWFALDYRYIATAAGALPTPAP